MMLENVEIIRSKRRTIAIEITRDSRVILRAPYKMSEQDIWKVIEKKTAWIERHLTKISKYNNKQEEALTAEELHRLAEEALEDIPRRLENMRRWWEYPMVRLRYGIRRRGGVLVRLKEI